MKTKTKSQQINNLGDILKIVFKKLTSYEGEVLWCLLANAELIYNKKDYSGSWRYNGGCISEVVPNTDYMDFYCSHCCINMKNKKYKQTSEKLLGKLKSFGCLWKGTNDRFDYLYGIDLRTGKPKIIKNKKEVKNKSNGNKK